MNDRLLMFTNLLNKVPLEDVAKAFNTTEAAILVDFKYIMQKVNNYCFLRGVPAIRCETIFDAQRERLNIFPILKVIDLDKPPIYKIRHETFDGKLP